MALLVEELIGSVEIGFRRKDLPTDSSELSWVPWKPPRPVAEVGSGGFRIGTVEIAGGLGQRVVLDKPI